MSEEVPPRRPRRRRPRPVSSFNPKRPFTREEGLAAGLTVGRLRGPAYRQIIHGVYVDAGVADTPALLGQALHLLAPSTAWVSHATAARILGVPLPVLPGEHLSVLAADDRVRRAGVRCHVGPSPARVFECDGVVLSAPAQLFVELAEQLALVDLVVVGDWLVRNGWVTPGRLRDFASASRMKAAGAARAAAAFVRERVDSPMETRLRMLFVLAGFPEPVVNETFDVAGLGRRRFDLCWPGVKVIAEYDGRHHAQREEQWEADLERREQIDDAAWRIRVFTAKDVYNTPHRTLERMATVLRGRGLAGMPRSLDNEWRHHFPVREAYL